MSRGTDLNLSERKRKKVSESRTESTHVLKYEDINGEGQLFGGRLMSWIDETGGYAAIRHSCKHVVTAAVDNLQFKRGARRNQMVVLVAKVTFVGNTSMEVRVDSFVEEIDGRRSLINTAFVIYVAKDDEGNPTTIPYGLELTSPEEKMEYESALRRREIRERRRHEGF